MFIFGFCGRVVLCWMSIGKDFDSEDEEELVIVEEYDEDGFSNDGEEERVDYGDVGEDEF